MHSLSLTAYGKVFLVRKVRGSNNGQLFAMKILKKAYVTRKKKTAEHTLTERDVLESVRDFPFLATLHYAFQTDTKLHLIMGECVKRGGEGGCECWEVGGWEGRVSVWSI